MSADNYRLEDGCPSAARLRDVDIDQLMSRTVFTSDFETKHRLSNEALAKPLNTRKRKKESGRVDDDLARSVEIIKMRSALDPKRFYKKDKTISATKNIQIGRVVDSAVDFYHSRLPRKQRRNNLVEELLADQQLKQYHKKKYKEIMFKNMNKRGRYRNNNKQNNKKKRKNK